MILDYVYWRVISVTYGMDKITQIEFMEQDGGDAGENTVTEAKEKSFF